MFSKYIRSTVLGISFIMLTFTGSLLLANPANVSNAEQSTLCPTCPCGPDCQCGANCQCPGCKCCK